MLVGSVISRYRAKAVKQLTRVLGEHPNASAGPGFTQWCTGRTGNTKPIHSQSNLGFGVLTMCLLQPLPQLVVASRWQGWAPGRPNRPRGAPKHFSRLGVDSATQGRRRERETSPLRAKSSIFDFDDLACYKLNAACYWPLDGGVRVEYGKKQNFLGASFIEFLGVLNFQYSRKIIK